MNNVIEIDGEKAVITFGRSGVLELDGKPPRIMQLFNLFAVWPE